MPDIAHHCDLAGDHDLLNGKLERRDRLFDLLNAFSWKGSGGCEGGAFREPAIDARRPHLVGGFMIPAIRRLFPEPPRLDHLLQRDPYRCQFRRGALCQEQARSVNNQKFPIMLKSARPDLSLSQRNPTA